MLTLGDSYFYLLPKSNPKNFLLVIVNHYFTFFSGNISTAQDYLKEFNIEYKVEYREKEFNDVYKNTLNDVLNKLISS